MELKVWVDGIQRVVCGVNGNTTCNDVVHALCFATNQTGQYILIAKSKHNEDKLSPSQKPIEVLSKWGEYANDVHFVLKRTVDINGNTSNLHDQPPSLKNVFEQQLLNKKASQLKNISPQAPHPSLLKSSNGPTSDVSPKNTASTQNNNFNRVSQFTPSKSSKRDANDNIFKTPDKKVDKKKNEQSMSGIQTSLARGRLISSEERSKLRGSTPVMGSKLSTDRFKDPLRTMSIHKTRNLAEPMDTTLPAETISNDKQYPSNVMTSPYQPSVRRKPAATLEPLSADEKRIKEEVDNKRKERDQLLAKASELDAEIAIYRHKIQVLTDCIKEEEHRIERELIKKEREEMVQHETAIATLRKEIDDCQKDLDQQKKESETIQEEIRKIENALSKKYSEMDEVMMDIRKENLNALSLETSAASIISRSTLNGNSAFVKLHSENLGINHLNSLIGSKFYHRIGSTRKMMGSPRQLQTAVASTKNPQGVWV